MKLTPIFPIDAKCHSQDQTCDQANEVLSPLYADQATHFQFVSDSPP